MNGSKKKPQCRGEREREEADDETQCWGNERDWEEDVAGKGWWDPEGGGVTGEREGARLGGGGGQDSWGLGWEFLILNFLKIPLKHVYFLIDKKWKTFSSENTHFSIDQAPNFLLTLLFRTMFSV